MMIELIQLIHQGIGLVVELCRLVEESFKDLGLVREGLGRHGAPFDSGSPAPDGVKSRNSADAGPGPAMTRPFPQRPFYQGSGTLRARPGQRPALLCLMSMPPGHKPY